jgi:hypothetical protein
MKGDEKKEEAWNGANHWYQKALIEYKHKVEGLERERELIVGTWYHNSNHVGEDDNINFANEKHDYKRGAS